MLAYREEAYSKGNRMPNVVKPETGHPAFDKACHLFGIEMRHAPIDPVTTQVDVKAMANGGEATAKYEKTRAYRSASGDKAAKTRKKNLKDAASAKESAANKPA